MQAALDVAFQVAGSDASVLLRGESGTGKGVLARAIHARSPRANRPFVTVHCPSLSAELLESDLFGHVRGAFTSAVQDAEGKVTAAQGGTLFLDEIGELPLTVQPKLLRFLQEKAFERVGETRTRHGDVRILTATNRDLESDVAAGRFREDLLYRLNVIDLRLPPLRERRRDVPILTEHLLRFFARQSGKPVQRFTKEAWEAIQQHTWPGNLRELRNAIERGTILTKRKRSGARRFTSPNWPAGGSSASRSAAMRRSTNWRRSTFGAFWRERRLWKTPRRRWGSIRARCIANANAMGCESRCLWLRRRAGCVSCRVMSQPGSLRSRFAVGRHAPGGEEYGRLMTLSLRRRKFS